jgi:hypothetical protein
MEMAVMEMATMESSSPMHTASTPAHAGCVPQVEICQSQYYGRKGNANDLFHGSPLLLDLPNLLIV